MIFTQAPGGTRPAGEDVDDGAVGAPVTITNANNTGIASWVLSRVDVPDGPEADSNSALLVAAFASGNTPSVSGVFTPDCFGAFLIKLEVTGTDGSVAVDYGTFGCPNELGWFKPAFRADVESSKYGGQLRGWAGGNTDAIQAATRKAALKTATLQQPAPMVVGLRETAQSSFEVVGACSFNPSTIPTGSAGITRTIAFRALIFATVGMTPQIRVFNFTDGVQVAATVLSSAVTPNVPTWVTATLTVPTDLPNAEKTYEAQLRISAGVPGPTDRAFVLFAGFNVQLV